jgi:hypothetical protein
MINASNIFNRIQSMNPSISTVSSIGSFVSSQNEQVAEMVTNNIIKLLPTDSLAYKIATSTSSRFTEKKLWIIAFELEKNEEYKKELESEYSHQAFKQSAKHTASVLKLASNKEESSDVLKSIKNAGRKLGDYYAFLKNSKDRNFTKEFYSKKYSQNSANTFISL